MTNSLLKSASIATVLGAVLIVASCVTVQPPASDGPSFSLAPGATPSAVPVVTPVVTLEPGATLPPITPEPPVTAPPLTEPPPTQTPTLEPTPTPEHPDWPPGALEPREAVDHIGESATVCGNVNGTNWVFAERGHPTWINLGPAYPSLRFTAVIWGEQRREWPLNGKPDVVYLGKTICVTGTIQAYSSWAQIQNVSMADIQVIP